MKNMLFSEKIFVFNGDVAEAKQEKLKNLFKTRETIFFQIHDITSLKEGQPLKIKQSNKVIERFLNFSQNNLESIFPNPVFTEEERTYINRVMGFDEFIFITNKIFPSDQAIFKPHKYIKPKDIDYWYRAESNCAGKFITQKSGSFESSIDMEAAHFHYSKDNLKNLFKENNLSDRRLATIHSKLSQFLYISDSIRCKIVSNNYSKTELQMLIDNLLSLPCIIFDNLTHYILEHTEHKLEKEDVKIKLSDTDILSLLGLSDSSSYSQIYNLRNLIQHHNTPYSICPTDHAYKGNYLAIRFQKELFQQNKNYGNLITFLGSFKSLKENQSKKSEIPEELQYYGSIWNFTIEYEEKILECIKEIASKL